MDEGDAATGIEFAGQAKPPIDAFLNLEENAACHRSDIEEDFYGSLPHVSRLAGESWPRPDGRRPRLQWRGRARRAFV